jgi:hypothetical protein
LKRMSVFADCKRRHLQALLVVFRINWHTIDVRVQIICLRRVRCQCAYNVRCCYGQGSILVTQPVA